MTKKRPSLLCDQPPLFEFEGFLVRPFDAWTLWIENAEGEGTTFRKAEFLWILSKLFERNFD